MREPYGLGGVAMVKKRYVFLAALVLAGAAPMGAAAAGPGDGSLPTVPSGARPGPDVLYAAAPDVPLLQNVAPFVAAPILVSGQEAYRNGEYLYQDHLYDDYGADTGYAFDDTGSDSVGDIDYPTNFARYGGNAADLVELRIRPSADDVKYRFTLNTLLEPDTTIIALALNTDSLPTGQATLPRDPGAPFPGTDQVITTWGTGAEHSSLPTVGLPVNNDVAVTTDTTRNQITVTVPRTVSNPSGVVGATLAVGLHNGTKGWLRPVLGAPTATMPGGGGPTTSGIFNLGFRLNESYLSANTPPDAKQAAALQPAAVGPTTFARDINFTTIADSTVTPVTTVPASGITIRIFPSRLQLGEGRDFAPGDSEENENDAAPAGEPQFRGQLQPYSLYVPTTYVPGTPAGLTLDLHSLGELHYQYNGSKGVQQIGEQRGDLVATSLSRGTDGWYQGAAEYDVFEMWGDIASKFTLDPTSTAIAGYSMGGYATYRLAGLYPDLFGRAFTTVGPPGEGIWIPPGAPSGGAETLSNQWLENFRNVPTLNVASFNDELVPFPGPVAQNLGLPQAGVQSFNALGYPFQFDFLFGPGHFGLAVLGYDLPQAVSFLGDARIDRDPTHVTFAYAPASDFRSLGLVHDHAYWVSGVTLADPAQKVRGSLVPKAVVDARSAGEGLGDPTTTFTIEGLTPPGPPPFFGARFRRTLNPPPAITAANQLTLRLENVGGTHVDVVRAGLTPTATLTVPTTSDKPATVVLDGRFPVGVEVLEDGVPLPGASRTESGVTIPVKAGNHVYTFQGGDPAAVIPEAPVAALLPLAALAVVGAVVIRSRRGERNMLR